MDSYAIKRVNILILLFIMMIPLLPGCAVKISPQNAEEFRKIHIIAKSDKRKVFYVRRGFNSVANSFRNMAPRCLRKKVTSSSGDLINYNPSVIKTKNKVELELQYESTANSYESQSRPKGGYYLLVADAFRMSQNLTKVNMYFNVAESGTIAGAVSEGMGKRG